MYRSILMVVLLALPSMGLHAMGADKVTLCHNYGEISVGGPAVWAHLGHGDTVKEEGESCPTRPGTEPEPEETMSVVVMMRCEAQENDFVVVSFSASVDFASIQPVEASCPVALAELLDLGLALRSVTGGSAEADGSLHLFTDYLLLGEVPVDSEE